MHRFVTSMAVAAALVAAASSAQAGFEDDDMRTLAHQIKALSDKTIQDITADRIHVPGGAHIDFLATFRQISRQADEFANLPRTNAAAAKDQLLQSAHEMQHAVQRLTNRAIDLNHQQLLAVLAPLARQSDQLVDELN